MKLWIDDERPAPEGWTHARSAQEAMILLTDMKNWPTHISFDHDLGPGLSGYDVACTVESMLYEEDLVIPVLTVHSANPVGRARIQQVIRSINQGLS